MTHYKKISFSTPSPGMVSSDPIAVTCPSPRLVGHELSACDDLVAVMQSVGVRCALFTADGACHEGENNLLNHTSGHADCRFCRDHLSQLIQTVASQDVQSSDQLNRCNRGFPLLLVPLQRDDEAMGFLVGCTEGMDSSDTQKLPEQDFPGITFPSQLKISENKPQTSDQLFGLLQNLLKGNLDDTLTQARQNEEIDSLTNRLVQSYQELTLLHRTNDRMRISRNPQSFFKEMCEELRTSIHARWVMLLSCDSPDAATEQDDFTINTCAGSDRPDELLARLIWDRTLRHTEAGQGVLIDSTLDGVGSWTWPEPLETIISVPIYAGNRVMGVLTSLNKQDRQDFTASDIKLLMSLAGTSAMFHHNFRLYHDLQGLLIGSLRALTSSIDAKDRYTCGHSERVAWIARGLAEKMKLSDEEIETVYLGGLLHDVGKIGVPEHILCKPGHLEAHEFQEIKKHPLIGAGILQDIPQMTMVNQAVRSHHERYDGKGYPEGLGGKSIPLIGRIVQLADSFDAMISRRVYRRDLPATAAIAEIRRYSGTQFDPDIAEVFLNHAPETIASELARGVTRMDPICQMTMNALSS